MLDPGHYVIRVTSVKTDVRGERNALIGVEMEVLASGDGPRPSVRVGETMLLSKMDREEQCPRSESSTKE